MTLPNFLIIGAPKAGTTSLYFYLQQHPEIYMSPVKEPRFFVPEFYACTFKHSPKDRAMRLEEYCQLFEGVSREVAIGEASTDYLLFPDAADRIKSHLPQVKLVAILRDPAERAFSAYSYNLRDGMERVTFEQALQDEERRIREQWLPGRAYFQAGLYYAQLRRYYDRFDREQIKILLHDDLASDAAAVCRDLFGFLGVNDDFRPDLAKLNESRTAPRNRLLARLLMRNSSLKMTLKSIIPAPLQRHLGTSLKRLNSKEKGLLSSQTREQLVERYREDIRLLEDLIQRDLSKWVG